MPCVYRTAAPRDEEVLLTMSIHDWQKVEELLHEAMALAPEQRAEFLDAACGSDAELRAELNSLLMVGEDLSDGFLKSPLRGVLAQSRSRRVARQSSSLAASRGGLSGNGMRPFAI